MATEPVKKNGNGDEKVHEAQLVPASPANPSDRPLPAPVQFDPDDPVALYMNAAVFTQIQRVAHMMSSARLVPEHLQGTQHLSDCILVVAQAFRWRMDPFAVAQNTYVVRGRLGYEGKLVAAVINTNSRLEKRLSYTYSGSGMDRRVVVTARLKGEPADREVSGAIADWKTDNEQWKKAPDQMLAYRGAREWARRHMPEAVLGILADDDLDAIREPRSPVMVIQPAHLSPEALQGASVEAQDNAPEPSREKPAEKPAAAEEPGLEVVAEGRECAHPSVARYAREKANRGKTIACVDCGVELRINRDGIISVIEAERG